MAESYAVMFSFNNSALLEECSQTLPLEDIVIDVPQQVDVNEDHVTLLEATVPLSYINSNKRLSFSTYGGFGKNDDIQYELIDYKSMSSISGKAQFQVSNIPVTGQWIATNFFEFGSSNRIGHTNLAYGMLVTLTLVNDHRDKTGDDHAVFDIWSPPTYVLADDGTIKYGSALCVAFGNPRPVVSILKDGIPAANQRSMGYEFMTQVYASFDGMDPADVSGNYTCKAESGSAVIIRELYY